MDERQLYMKVQQMQQQMQQMEQYLEQMDEQLGQAQELKKSMEDFEDLEEGADLLVPISNGIFAKATLKDTDELKVNVGGQVVVSKNIAQTKELIDEQVVELKKAKEDAQKEYDNLSEEAEKMAQEIQAQQQ